MTSVFGLCTSVQDPVTCTPTWPWCRISLILVGDSLIIFSGCPRKLLVHKKVRTRCFAQYIHMTTNNVPTFGCTSQHTRSSRSTSSDTIVSQRDSLCDGTNRLPYAQTRWFVASVVNAVGLLSYLNLSDFWAQKSLRPARVQKTCQHGLDSARRKDGHKGRILMDVPHVGANDAMDRCFQYSILGDTSTYKRYVFTSELQSEKPVVQENFITWEVDSCTFQSSRRWSLHIHDTKCVSDVKK